MKNVFFIILPILFTSSSCKNLGDSANMQNSVIQIFVSHKLGQSSECKPESQVKSILISYGTESGPPLYTYHITQHGNAAMSCELVSRSSIVDCDKFAWRTNIDILIHELMIDFSRASLKLESSGIMPKESRKMIKIVCYNHGVEITEIITGDDELLATFIEKSVVIRELFCQIVSGKPKMYRLRTQGLTQDETSAPPFNAQDMLQSSAPSSDRKTDAP